MNAYFDMDTQYAHFQENPLCQNTEWHFKQQING